MVLAFILVLLSHNARAGRIAGLQIGLSSHAGSPIACRKGPGETQLSDWIWFSSLSPMPTDSSNLRATRPLVSESVRILTDSHELAWDTGLTSMAREIIATPAA